MPQEKTRWFRFRSRGGLIAATVLLQALVIGLGWLATMHMTRSGLEDRVRERVLEDGAAAAQDLAAQLAASVHAPIRTDHDACAIAQRLVEAANTRGPGTIMLLDPQGRVLCHPDLEANPGLTRMDYSEQFVTLDPGGERVELGQLRPLTPITGEAMLLSGPAPIAIVDSPETQSKIVVIQNGGTPERALSRATGGVMRWFAIGGAAVLLLTILGSALLVKLYDSVLERANHHLGAELARRVRRGLAIRDGLIFGLAKLADYRDTDTGRHLERLSHYCECLARELRDDFPQIDAGWIELIKLASSLHDIGKVGVADSILLKPGRFTPEERRVMEMHTVFGADTLIAIRARVGDDELLNMSIQVALSHHERFDGTGYPYRLVGEQIPLCARVVALADMYDALTSKRVYKPAMPHAEARTIILDLRGTHFDARVVDAFERAQEAFEAIRSAAQAEGAMDRPRLVSAVEQAQAAAGPLAA